MAVSTAIYTILHSDASIAAITGTGIYPVIVPNGKPIPAIVYNVIGLEPTQHKDNETSWDTYNIEVTALNKTMASAESLGVLIRAAIIRYHGTVGSEYIETGNLTNLRWDFGDDFTIPGDGIGSGMYVVTINFDLTIK